MKIIFLGPPGAGKGTQGELLAKKLKLPRLSVGAILRRVWEKGGKSSEEIAEYILKGLNVPAKLLFEVLEPWFVEHNDGFIIDNLPRNNDQLKELKKFLERNDMEIDKVFHLVVSEEESVKRLSCRLRKQSRESVDRLDEEPEVIKTRIKEGYQKEVAPILTFFKELGILVEINGEQSIAKVHQQILENLELK